MGCNRNIRKCLKGSFSRISLSFAGLIFPVLLFLPSLINFYVISEFQLNRDYISQNLCVNKAEKNSHCKGTCYLKNKLEEKKDARSSLPEEKIREEIGSKYIYNIATALPLLKVVSGVTQLDKDEDVLIGPVNQVFRPPVSKS